MEYESSSTGSWLTTHREIRRCRKMTSKPFGVNLTLLPALQPPDYPAYARVIIEEGIRIVETAGNNPAPVIKQLKAADPPIIILHKCTTVRHALSAIKLGVDFLCKSSRRCKPLTRLICVWLYSLPMHDVFPINEAVQEDEPRERHRALLQWHSWQL